MSLGVADVEHDGIEDVVVVVGAPLDSRAALDAGAVHWFRGGDAWSVP